MNDFNAAIARLQASATKIEAKVDALNAGSQTAIDTALSAAALQINAISDGLDAKSA